MDDSTTDVGLQAGFISDLLRNYESARESVAAPLFALANQYDLSNPAKLVPMELYNTMCTWIEKNLGPASLKIAGQNIGERVYNLVVASGAAGPNPDPLAMLRALKYAAETMIEDPAKRGWEIVESGPEHALMRRTQTFNSILQHGLLTALVAKTGVRSPSVTLVKSVASGEEFDEYRIAWIPLRNA